MKENKYDDHKFFDAYREFPRSKWGLEAAGEWQQFKSLLPNFQKKAVLDIGCGYGWHCEYAHQQGAADIVGIDISEKMLEVAKQKSPTVTYLQMAMEDISFEEDRFDIVISSLAFHYTSEFEQICRAVHKCLKRDGAFIFSVEHPVFTAQGKQEWIYDKEGKKAHWPVDNYFYEGKREAVFLGETVIKYHRTLTTYLQVLIKVGFVIQNLIEPIPDQEAGKYNREMNEELRRPMMLMIAAKKI